MTDTAIRRTLRSDALGKTQAANEFAQLILILTLLNQTLQSTHVQKLWMIPSKGMTHLFEISVPFNIYMSFQMVADAFEVGHVHVYVEIAPSCACNALFTFS